MLADASSKDSDGQVFRWARATTGLGASIERFRNAEALNIRVVRVDYLPMANLSQHCIAIFRVLDRDDDYQADILRQVWRLRTTLSSTLLSFDDLRLGIDELVAGLSQAKESVPTIADHVAAVQRAIDQMRSGPENPKRQRAIECLNHYAAGSTAVLTRLSAFSTPGWPASLTTADLPASSAPCFLSRRSQLDASTFKAVLIPAALRFAPRNILMDLFYGGRAAEVTVLLYTFESFQAPSVLTLPCAIPTLHTKRVGVTVHTSSEDSGGAEKWAENSLWSSMRAQHGDLLPNSEEDELVGARFVLYADGSANYLPEDGRVVEVSSLFSLSEFSASATERLPRKAVAELEEGDIVMLRVAGSGDYLEEVADSLLADAGQQDLRQAAIAWKIYIYQALRSAGEGVVGRLIRNRGVTLRSPKYLWEWAGNSVMAPQDLETFRILLQVAGEILGNDQLIEVGYADHLWQNMEKVKSFQQRAGAAIRAALVERVKVLIRAGQSIETAESIALPGVQGGQMGLFRIAAVDSTVISVPASKLFRREKVKVR